MSIVSRLRHGWAMLDPRAFALAPARCPFCGPSLFVRLSHGEGGLRCLRCAASTVHLSIGLALTQAGLDLAACDAYELSAAGPYVAHLRRTVRHLECSEFHPDAVPGTAWHGVRCEDVQRLTFPAACFDLVTHTEVMEHVADDARAFAELRRVLRPGGRMLFSVPLSDAAETVERARYGSDGRLVPLLPAAYHVDPFKGGVPVLVFRDYGRDLVQRLERAGFDEVRIAVPHFGVPWAALRPVVSARAA